MQLFSFKQGFLKQQKVSRRSSKQKKKRKNNFVFFTLAASLILCSGLGYCLFSMKNSMSLSSTKIDETWVVTSSFFPPSKEEAEKSLDPKLFKNKTLLELTNSLRKADPYNQIVIVKTGPKKIHINIQKRQAVMNVHVDKLRKVSTRGFVFGQGEDGQHPTLTGVFTRKKNEYNLSERNALITTATEQKKIEQALTILKISQSLGLNLKEIKFTPYRGFSAHLTQGAWLVLGSRPFDYKIKKFLELERQLAKEHKIIMYMELDYRGKAFIKTKNTGV